MSGFAEILAAWGARRDQPHALATIVRTSGSTYRKAGARMLVAGDGRSVGLLSGGCLESEIVQYGVDVLRRGRPVLSAFDTRRVLGCNGRMEVLVEPVPSTDERHLLAAAATAHARREPIAGVSIFASDAKTVDLGSFALSLGAGVPQQHERVPAEFLHAAQEALLTRRPRTAAYRWNRGMVEALVHGIPPPVRLVVFGAGPDVAPLARFALELGWEVLVLTHPTQEPPLLPARCTAVPASPEELTALLSPDPWTAAIVMTHNFGRDLAYLARLLPLQLPYVSLLGPRQRREEILAELAGVADFPSLESLQCLHSPAGLDLGADGPEEIALSIVAQIKLVMAGRADVAASALQWPAFSP